MKHFFSILSLLLFSGVIAKGQGTIDFNTSTDLTTNFNSSINPVLVNGNVGGLANTGAVDIVPVNEIWTLKTPLPRSNWYKISVYARINGNAGRGGIGITTKNSNSPSTFGHPDTTIGFAFHGGGGEFMNNSSISSVSWPPDLIQLNWYYIELLITEAGANTFDIDFKIFNSDANGVIGSLKTNKTFTGIVNSSLGSRSTVYPYFCHSGVRLSKLDDFTTAIGSASLPVEFLNFKTKRKTPHEVELSWQTATELNNNGFSLERMFEQETEFSAVDWIEGMGTTRTLSNYKLLDQNSYEGTTYYRLKQIDNDGTCTYSDIKAVEGDVLRDKINLFPNPVENKLNIYLGKTLRKRKVVGIEIINVNGQTIKKYKKMGNSQSQVINLNGVGDISRGVYYVKIQLDTDEFLYVQFIKD